MPRHRSYRDRDDAPLPLGDSRFIGVDERHSGAAPGFVTQARNFRFRDGVAEPRRGIWAGRWGKGDGTTPFSSVEGAAVAQDASGFKWLLVAAEGKVYITAPNNVAQEVSLPVGVTLSGEIDFVETNNQVMLGRGLNASPLRLRSFNSGFEEVTDATSGAGNGTGALTIPNFQHAEWVDNRLVIVGDEDVGYTSDALNPTRYSIFDKFRFNKGGKDNLVRFMELNDDAIIAFKTDSVLRIHNLVADANGDWSALKRHEITSNHGLAAARAVAKVGSDGGESTIWYLNTNGAVTSVRRTEEGTFHSVDLPLSETLKESFGRINQKHIGNAVMAWHDNKLFLAAPLDDAQRLGDEIASSSDTYSDAYFDYVDTRSGVTVNHKQYAVTAGQKYKYAQGASDKYLVNGSTRIEGDSVFVAAGSTVDVVGNFDDAVTASLKPVSEEGVNNGVFVYDFENNAWAGVDEAEGILYVKRWVKLDIAGRERLCFVSNDGYIRVYPDGDENAPLVDEIWSATETPYVDVVLTRTPGHGETIQVNGGDTITLDVGASSNGAASWGAMILGVQGVAQTGANLWADWLFAYGYNPDASVASWSAPNTTPTQIKHGVRFTATNGTLPTVTHNITGLIVDSHAAARFIQQEIDHLLITRGYGDEVPGQKAGVLVRLHLETWNPKLTVTQIMDGVNERFALATDVTRDRTKYLITKQADYVETNASDDHGAEKREDYSVVFHAADGIQFNSNGLAFERHQEWSLARRAQGRGRYVRYEIRGTQGRAALRAIQVEQRAGGRALTLKA